MNISFSALLFCLVSLEMKLSTGARVMDRLAGFCIDELIDCWLFFFFHSLNKRSLDSCFRCCRGGWGLLQKVMESQVWVRVAPVMHPVSSTFRIYPESDHLAPSPLPPLVRGSVISRLIAVASSALKVNRVASSPSSQSSLRPLCLCPCCPVPSTPSSQSCFRT